MEAKFGALEEKDKEMIAINPNDVLSEEQPVAPFLTTEGMKKVWKS